MTGRLSGRVMSVNPEREPLEDRLPPSEPIVTDFVGRESELRRLWEWFDDPISRRWLLAGEGGKGKTALAFEFGKRIKLPLEIAAERSGAQSGATGCVAEGGRFELPIPLRV